MNTNEELKTRPDFRKLYPGEPLNDNAHRRVEGFVYGCETIWTTHVEPLQAGNNDLHLKAAELHSLKMSLLESPLKEFLPKKEMSFHDKILFAIHGLQHAKLLAYDQTQEIAKNLQSENQKLREQLKRMFINSSDYQVIDEVKELLKLDKTNP